MTAFRNLIPQHKVVRSTAAQVVGQLFAAICSVAILKLLTEHLGVHNYGIYATAIVFVSAFALLTDLGVNTITAREIAKYPDRADDIINYNLGLRLLLCAIFTPIIIIMSYFIYSSDVSSLRISIAVLTTYLFFDSARSVMLGYFAAKVRNEIIALVGGLQQLSLLLLCIVAVLVSRSVYFFIAAYVVSSGIGAAMAAYVTRRHVKLVPRASLRYWRGIVVMSISVGIIQIINMVYLKADSILLSILKSPAEVGIYGVAYAMVLVLSTLPTYIMLALMPSMATSVSGDALAAIVEKAFSYLVMFAALLAIAGYVVGRDLVLVVSNVTFLGAATPFAVLCLATAFSYVYGVFAFACVSVHRHQKIVFVSVGALILNIVLNLVLIPRYSVDGAAWATVISEIAAAMLVYQVFVRETGVVMRLGKHVYRPVIAAGITVSACALLKVVWHSQSAILNVVVASGVMIAVYCLALAVLRGFPAEVTAMASRIVARRRHA